MHCAGVNTCLQAYLLEHVEYWQGKVKGGNREWKLWGDNTGKQMPVSYYHLGRSYRVVHKIFRAPQVSPNSVVQFTLLCNAKRC